MQIIGDQTIGFAGGVWKGVKGKPGRILHLAIGVIFLAVSILVESNTVIESCLKTDFR